MNAEMDSSPKSGMSTQKKWLIGCGGCLGVLVILAIVLTALAWFVGNAVKDVSNKSVQQIFGPNYKAEGYTAIGLPLGQANVKNMVLLINPQQGKTLVALDMAVSPSDMQVIKSGQQAQVKKYLETTSTQISQSSSARSGSTKVEDIRIDAIESVALQPGGKQLPLANATVKAEQRKQISYSPAVAALIPEANNRMVVLIATDPQTSTTDNQADFSSQQKTLRDEVLQIIKDSDLDERLQ